MESHKYKNITLEVFRRLRAEPAFRAEARLGIALQVYMRDTERDLDELIAWARAERLPVSVRLVKGAYWDYENIIAEQNGWPSPVYSRKAETDLAFERCARKILEDRDLCHLACATHNLRSIAAVLATAEALNVPSDRYEFQLLYGMAEPVRKALQTQADTVRLYCPYGQLVPGMAYLVRRLLENTANESFLRQGFVEHADIGRLLEDPQHALAPEPGKARPPGPAFRNEPAADFTRADVRAAFSKAIADVRRQLGRTYPLFIAGREVSTDEFTETRNPANPVEVIGRVCHASRREVSTAIVAGREAFPAWRDMPVRARAGFLRKAAEIARRRIHELAAWQILEVGKQWDQAHADVAEAIDFLEFYAREMERLAEPRRVGAVPGELNQTLYEPRGVAVVIAPWNFPLAISCGMCAAALAAGNTVVYKPSDKSVVTGHMLLELFREAGLPAGVFNYVPGRGSEIGDFLVEHPDVALVAFTGSVEVGLRIIEKAGKLAPGQTHVKGVIAEMGGKNAIIVDDDADLDEAVPGVLQSAFGYQGQKCSACSRVIVLDAVHDAFVARLVEAARSMKLGPAEDPSNAMGPVEDAAQQQSCLEYIEIGKREGRLLYIGEVPGGGCYVPVTIIGGITPAHRLAQEEVFGPVLAVMRVKDFDEALAWANSARFALTGGVYSRSPRHLERARREFRVGNLYLNRGCTGALVERHPFGGFKLSGVGTKAGGTDYLLHFLHPRAISENTLRRGFAPADQL
jgi:RHH-type proline utilization regulon transcriptional repressor/proline dehydrogenase/delta 1-pyrroline-5-carboxylate dehydrogenase